jgi:hypothetical protein
MDGNRGIAPLNPPKYPLEYLGGRQQRIGENMTASFPGAVKTWTALVDGIDQAQAAQVNSIYDEVSAVETQLLVNGVTKVKESGGPTTLTLGAIADGQALIRSGSTVVGTSLPSGMDGWQSPGTSWSYASVTTITVPSGAASIYAVGDKIKLTQARSQAYNNDPAAGSGIVLNMAATAGFNVGNKVLVSSSAGSEVAIITAVVANTSITVDVLALNHTTTNPMVYIGTTTTGIKYFYVVAVADTLLTILGGSDYTLENAAISLNFYSHATSPVGFPQFFNWLPTMVGWTTYPITKARFNLVGRMMLLKVNQNSSASNSVNMTFTTPAAAAYDAEGMSRWLMDNGVALAYPGRTRIVAGSITLTCYKDMTSTTWTASGNKAMDFETILEI